MAIDWKDPNVKIPALLTSPDPLERAKGRVYHILQTDPTNIKTGDELFAEQAGDCIGTIVKKGLLRWFGLPMSQDIEQKIQEAAHEVLSDFFEQVPYDIRVSLDSPTGVNITFTKK